MIVKENLNEAFNILQKAEKIKTTCHIYNGYGMIAQKKKNWIEALNNFQEALNINPEYSEALCNKGSVLIELNRLDDAILALKNSISIDSNNPEAYNNLGVALFK
jgi:tetratricopeptide (TPR) repeat protein